MVLLIDDLGKGMDTDAMDLAWVEMDRSGDGQVSREEFERWWRDQELMGVNMRDKLDAAEDAEGGAAGEGSSEEEDEDSDASGSRSEEEEEEDSESEEDVEAGRHAKKAASKGGGKAGPKSSRGGKVRLGRTAVPENEIPNTLVHPV